MPGCVGEFPAFSFCLIGSSANKQSTLEIITTTTATNVPEETEATYQKAFAKIGFKKVGFISMCNSCDDDEEKLITRIEKSNMVLFSGG